MATFFSARASSLQSMKILDTHQHLWELTRFRYAWCEQIAGLHRSFTQDDYEADAAGTGIDGSIFVEADVDQEFLSSEAQWALSLAADESGGSLPIVGVVAAVRPESPDFARQIELIANEKLKGVRRLLQAEPDALSKESTFRRHVRMLGDYGLSFDICMLDHQLPLAIELVDSCPGVSFTLDHAGNPGTEPDRFELWRNNLQRLAERENVSCKISGLMPVSGRLPELQFLRQVINHVVESFGWDRVMFGSDWPLCTLASSLKGWVDLALDLTQQFGRDNQQKLFRENAERIYRCSGNTQ
jgi:predicted TIM-barrel fold metal-dependent hydrolase